MNIDAKFTDGRLEPRPDPLALSAVRRIGLARLAWPAAGVAAMCLLCVWAIDRPVAMYFKALSDTAMVGFFRVVTDLGQSAIWYAVGVIGVLACWLRARAMPTDAARFAWRRRARSFLFLVASMLASGTLVNLLKMIFGRYRPRFLFDAGVYDFAPFALDLKSSGFPSGHTQSIVAAMIALGFIWPRGRWVFFAVAAVVAASRFITTVHYVSDVIAGAFVAAAVALIMRGLFERNGIALAWTDRAANEVRPRN
ncbi:MAG: phosphatase PAP2 family protein [Rhodospirillaceae bacterium]|nr:phosphatase PAP2 family protein [Rhodospirillaceae bacterium]